jgi:hypothetical protein
MKRTRELLTNGIAAVNKNFRKKYERIKFMSYTGDKIYSRLSFSQRKVIDQLAKDIKNKEYTLHDVFIYAALVNYHTLDEWRFDEDYLIYYKNIKKSLNIWDKKYYIEYVKAIINDIASNKYTLNYLFTIQDNVTPLWTLHNDKVLPISSIWYLIKETNKELDGTDESQDHLTFRKTLKIIQQILQWR